MCEIVQGRNQANVYNVFISFFIEKYCHISKRPGGELGKDCKNGNANKEGEKRGNVADNRHLHTEHKGSDKVVIKMNPQELFVNTT